MYVAPRFLPADPDEPVHVINRVRFGTLVTHTENGFDATPVPWVAERDGENVVLWGHLAAANSQLAEVRSRRDVLVTFTGVNGYISPGILPTPQSAPTWNYVAVHAYGDGSLLDASGTEYAVEKLVQAMEAGRRPAWTTAEMGPRREKLLGHVVGLQIVVNRIEAKFKLGQNESDADLHAIIASLEAGGEYELAADMRNANAHRKSVLR